MDLERLVSPLARLYYLGVKKREREIGYRLSLPVSASHWMPSTIIFDMSPVWKRFGLAAIGVNYCTIGAVKNGLSTRFDPTSPYYQAWFGGYVTRFPTPRAWTLDEHFSLGVADQKNWLELYGAKNPFVEVQKDSVKNLGPITVCGRKGTLYEGNILSNTDVGNARPFALPFMMAGMAQLLNAGHRNPRYASSDFIPNWSPTSPLASFEKILLRGYIAIIPLDAYTSVILYANSCEFTDQNGRRYDHFKTVRKDLRAMMSAVRIQKC